jgi:hypothetical protein
MKDGQRLRAEHGRAEVLLAPSVFLLLDENSALQMNQGDLHHARLTLGKGSALIEIVLKLKGNRIRGQLAESRADIEKEGVYRFEAGLHALRVYKGEAVVARGTSKITVKGGKMADLGNDLASADFDRKIADSLHRWAAQRSLELFMRNEETRRQGHWVCLGAGWL